MKSNPPSVLDKGIPGGHPTSDSVRWLYAGTAVLLLLLTFWGFQQFYIHGKAVGGRPLTPQIKFLVMAHGVAMTVWVVLLVMQSLLVAKHRIRMHIQFGMIGAALALCIFIVGFKLGIESARFAPAGTIFAPGGAANGTLTPKEHMAVPIVLILIFAVYVFIGILYRKIPKIHRPLMLFATVNIVGPATARISFFRSIYDDTLWGEIFGPFSIPIAIGILFLIAHSLITRTVDWHVTVIFSVSALVGGGMMKLAPTEAWDSIASFLLSI